MPKKNFGNITGTCTVCNINMWDSTDNKPAIWPCNVQGCPYENPLAQNISINEETWSKIGSGLGQIDF